MYPAAAVTMTGDARRIVPGAYPATGLLRCAGGVGTGHLVGSGRTILTAAHVVVGSESAGCTFTIAGPTGVVTSAVDLSRLRSGSRSPRQEPAARDWAVVELRQPIAGVRPYALGPGPAKGAVVTLVSARTLTEGGATVERCRVQSVMPGPEVALDCSAQSGDSGAAVLTSRGVLGAVYVGYRSTAPARASAYSAEHYNFAIPITARIRAALAGAER
jgi:hypothetical protein